MELEFLAAYLRFLLFLFRGLYVPDVRVGRCSNKPSELSWRSTIVQQLRASAQFVTVSEKKLESDVASHSPTRSVVLLSSPAWREGRLLRVSPHTIQV